jgi:hypothetical protein
MFCVEITTDFGFVNVGLLIVKKCWHLGKGLETNDGNDLPSTVLNLLNITQNGVDSNADWLARVAVKLALPTGQSPEVLVFFPKPQQLHASELCFC